MSALGRGDVCGFHPEFGGGALRSEVGAVGARELPTKASQSSPALPISQHLGFSWQPLSDFQVSLLMSPHLRSIPWPPSKGKPYIPSLLHRCDCLVCSQSLAAISYLSVSPHGSISPRGTGLPFLRPHLLCLKQKGCSVSVC